MNARELLAERLWDQEVRRVIEGSRDISVRWITARRDAGCARCLRPVRKEDEVLCVSGGPVHVFWVHGECVSAAGW